MDVIFDTNAYRYLAHGRTIEQVTDLMLVILKEEGRVGIKSFIAPTVWLELFNHFEDERDPHFSECLCALVGSYLHTHNFDGGVIANIAPNVTMLTAQVLIGNWNSEEEAIVKQMDDIASVIFAGPWPETALKQNYLLRFYWQMIRRDEDQFVKVLNKMVGEYHERFAEEKDVAKRLRTSSAIIQICKVYAIGVAVNSGKKLENLASQEVEAMGTLLEQMFPAPFHLYVDIVSRFISNPDFDASKGSRRNWNWDFQMLFYITPNNHFILVTDDKDIAKAAIAAGIGHKVKTLRSYLGSLSPELEAVLYHPNDRLKDE